MSQSLNFPQIEFRSRAELRRWLDANHTTAGSFWLVTFKKHVRKHYIPYPEIVEELLCYGWIDTRTKRTLVPGLFLTGQDVLTPGIAGALWGGMLSAAAIDPRVYMKLG